MVTLSVFFDAPFRVGVLEIVSDGEPRAARLARRPPPPAPAVPHARTRRPGPGT